MCSPSSRAAQRKYNASEHGKEVRKAYNLRILLGVHEKHGTPQEKTECFVP